MKKVLIALLVLSFAKIYSQDQNLDSSFGEGGKVLTNINGITEKAYDLVIQSDEKIVIAGYTYSEISGNDFICIRYNSDGSLDGTFGTGGIATFDLQLGSDDIAYSIDIEMSGKLILAGYSDDGSNKEGALIRVNTDGTIDESFGNSGVVLTDFTTNDDFRDDEYKVVKIHHLTGGIIVGGTSYESNIDSKPIFAKYTNDGNLDTSFGNNGKVTSLPYPLTGWTHLFVIEDIAVKSNGKITGIGWVKPTTGGPVGDDASHYECRLNSDGTLDTSFSEVGYDTRIFATSDHRSYAVVLNPDDSFYFGGEHVWNNNTKRIHLGLTNATGSNTEYTNFEFWENIQVHCYALAKDSDGKLLIGGSIVDASTENSSFLLMRVKPDYYLDTTLDGDQGFITTHFNNEVNQSYAMKIQADGKIVLAGFSGNKIALARYLPIADTSGTDEIEDKSLVKLYPNPSSTTISITLNNSTTDLSYDILDMNGRIIKSGTIVPENNNSINIESLENGIYIVNLNNNEINSQLKFIKK